MVRHPRESGSSPSPGQAEKPRSKPGSAKPDAAKPEIRAERVAKALARAGVASRREVERLINLGKVAVNGRVLETPAVLVKRDDILTVDGKVVNGPEAARVWRYHKPVGLVTTHKDPQGRPTVFDHLPEGLPRVISIGRLDLNSEGLLLLTNDGGLARALELPATGWRRVYRARAYGRTTQAELDRLQDGITLEGVRYGPVEARLDKAEEKADGRANLWITVSLSEGKNREVRRVLEGLGLKVNRLIRLAYGPFQLGTLASGTVEEVGPRVIREQLSELIAPQNLPSGDRSVAPASKPGRRPMADAPTAPRGTGDPIADPTRKPSRTRAALAAARTALDAPAPPRARPGGDRATAPRGKAPYKPREGSGGEERPRRAYSDKPSGPRTPSGGGFGKAPYKPREGGEDRPRRTFGEKPPSGSGFAKASSKPRERTEGAEDRPRRSYGDKPTGPRTGPGGGKAPYKPRERTEGAEDRPRRSYGDKPTGPRTGPGGGKAPYKPRERTEGAEDRPRRSYGDKPTGPRTGPSGGKAPYKPRERTESGASDDRPRRSYGDKPTGPRTGPSGGKAPYKPREGAGADRPARNYGGKPSAGGPKGPRGAGKGPRPGGARPPRAKS
jgi:23S rRNA pseudouridine2605 synthase